MGIVYRAFDPLFERELAIKTMFDQTSDGPNFRARFFREAKSAGKLKHPNIVTVYDLGEENGRPYLYRASQVIAHRLSTRQEQNATDFTASFNLSFLNAKGAVWIMRAASDLSDCYVFQLTGPKGIPPCS